MRELADRHDRYTTEGSREVQGAVNEPSVLSGAGQRDDSIIVVGASQNNLKNISVRIPKKMITVFTGVSGSGKSSLCLDTIAVESRRALNETFPSYIQNYLPRYGRPEVKQIGSLPVCILIDQKKPAANNRSTVATYTDLYAFLRLLFSRVGKPFAGYSDTFSFNHPAGKCPCCDGLGVTTQLDIHKLIDFNKSLNDEDVIHFPTFTTGAWRWKRYANSGLFDNDKKIRDYSAEELDLLLNAPQQKLKDPPKNWPAAAKYEGIVPRMYRSIIQTKEAARHKKQLDELLSSQVCPECGGTRLNERVRNCKINGKSIADVMLMSVDEAIDYIGQIEDPLAADLRSELLQRLGAMREIGLSYLTLGRETGTLSGGEAQRIKIAKYIHSALSDLVYVLDEPSVGLHPRDIERLKRSLRRLRDQGNTILIVEHHREIIEMADHCIDIGPGAGSAGGQIMFEGDYEGLYASDTVTGRMLRARTSFRDCLPDRGNACASAEKTGLSSPLRSPKGFYHLEHATLHNLRDLTVDFPMGVLTVIAGVAGSGKSSLMECFHRAYGPDAIFIGQKNIGISLRSTPATYLEIADPIRKLFGTANHVSMKKFTFNGEGACPACGGKGIIVSEMAFMEDIVTTCDLCKGTRYSQETLAYRYRGRGIDQVMGMSVDEAADFFAGESFLPALESLQKVGLGYLRLDQSTSTLSGGELQRMKLAGYLHRKGDVFIIDEPTAGLHLQDIERLMNLFQEMTDAGNSLFLIEHSPDVMKAADWIIELGPEGGAGGGSLLYSGIPSQIMTCPDSVTAPWLSR